MKIEQKRLSDDDIAAATKGSLSEPRDIKGCYLEIQVRYGGKSKHAYFRYNGIPFGEGRGERVPLGSCEQGLSKLRRECSHLETLIEQGKSPKRYRKQQQEVRAAASMTFREAFEEYWQHQITIWSPGTIKQSTSSRKHIEQLAIMDMPLDTIRASHLEEAIGEMWRRTSGAGRRVRYLILGTFRFQLDKDDGVFRGPNPASTSKISPLSRALGPGVESAPRTSIDFADIPRVAAYFNAPQDHWYPGYLTIVQAAAAYAPEYSQHAIRIAADRKGLQGIIMTPATWGTPKRLIPIPELNRHFGEFVHEPQPQEQESARLHNRLLRFLIFTPVRLANACQLRWRNIHDNVQDGIGVIEYLPKRRDPATGKILPSEHKLGWKISTRYSVMLTDNLRKIIEEQRQQQILDGVKIVADGLVFMHGKTRLGEHSWQKKPAGHTSVEVYLDKAIKRLNAEAEEAGEAAIRLVPFDATRVTVQGFRATFTTWAKENNYSDDLINLSLGHLIPAIRENPTNKAYFHNVKLLEKRLRMMEHWERYCLSLVESRSNVVPIPAKRKRR
jgi:integrase